MRVCQRSGGSNTCESDERITGGIGISLSGSIAIATFGSQPIAVKLGAPPSWPAKHAPAKTRGRRSTSLLHCRRQRIGKVVPAADKENGTAKHAEHANGYRVNLLSKRIISCALMVLHALGAGFLEKVYENTLAHELRKSGLAVSQQHPMVVRYDGVVVGEYAVDLLVEHVVAVELKAAKAIDDIHRTPGLNYLKAKGLHLCLLLNFGKPRLEIKRIVLAL